MRRKSPSLISNSITRLEDRLAPAIINFALNPATSSLTLSGSIGGNAITAQQTGSLTAKYSGNIRIDVDYQNNTIQFVDIGTNATAANFSSNLTPAVGGGSAFSPGNGPANYGGKANVSGLNTTLAARNMVAAYSSFVQVLGGAGSTRTFTSNQQVTITSGTVDYNNLLLQGNDTLVGQGGPNSAADGTITDNGNGSYTLVLPGNATINDDVSGQPLILNIVGTLNGSAILPFVDLNGASTGQDSTFNYSVGSPPVKVAPTGTITEIGSPNLTSMTVTLTSPPDGVAESLALDLTGLTGLSATAYNSATGELIINGPASLATFQAALQRVTYVNSNPSATPGPRTVLITATDGNNASFTRTALGTVGATTAHVGSVTVNDGSVQRSRVTSLTVNFDSKLSVDPTVAAFQLQRNGGGSVNLGLTVDNSGPTTKAILTFTGGSVNGTSLADGRYNLTINGSLINGGNFDGGGGLGSNFQLTGDPAVAPKLYRLYGDADGNNTVNASDFGAFRGVFGTSGPSIFDFDESGGVTATDFAQFRARFGTGV